MTGFRDRGVRVRRSAASTPGRRGDPRLRNWPVVYLLDNPAEIYVGESLNTVARLRQHLDSPEQARAASLRE